MILLFLGEREHYEILIDSDQDFLLCIIVEVIGLVSWCDIIGQIYMFELDEVVGIL